MKKALLFILVLVIVIPVALIATSSLWLNIAVGSAIEKATGFPTHIGKIDLNLAGTSVGINDITIKNPKTFQDDHFVSIPEIYVDFELAPLIQKQNLYFKDIRINIEEVSVVKNKEGKTNLGQLKAVTQSKSEMAKEEQKAKKAQQAKSPQSLNFFVENLSLTMRRVRYHDESQPMIGEKLIDLKIQNQRFEGISSVKDIVRIIVLQITYKAALGNLGIPVDVLQGHLDSTLALGEDLAKQGTEIANQALGEGQRALEGAMKQIPDDEQIGKTVGEVSQKAKGLFGSAEKFLKNTTDQVKK